MFKNIVSSWNNLTFISNDLKYLYIYRPEISVQEFVYFLCQVVIIWKLAEHFGN